MATELVAAALAGDRGAWAGIWDLHGPKLHSYAWRLLGNDHDAQDAVADTFVSAAENLHQLRDPEQLRPWLYAICRRHVQRRWQQRDKVKPMDDMVAVVDAQEPAVNVLGVDAAEATSLLWEAAEGLGPAERELLSLVLTAELDSGEVARITGDKPDAVYVKVSRLKDGLGRAAGALLVARHHREDCAELDQLLRDWDGQYSALWRKRIARHVDRCETCGASQKTAAGALFGIAGVGPLLALATLRDRCVSGDSSPDLVPVSFELGWPVPQPWERKRRRILLPVAFAAAAAVVALALVLTTGTDAEPTASPLATAVPTTPAATAQATTAPPTTAPPTAVRSATARPTTAKPVVKPSAKPAPTAKPTTAAPLPAAPTISLALSDTALETGNGSTTTATATVSGTGTTTRISWNGTAPGSKTFPGSGSATIGPYSSVSSPSGTDTITVTATVTDALGRKATATRTFTVSVTPQ